MQAVPEAEPSKPPVQFRVLQDALHRAIMSSRLRLTLKAPDDISAVSFSPDGKEATRDGQPRPYDEDLQDATTGRELMTLSGHKDAVSSVTFSADGKRLATASDDNTAKIWDADTGRELKSLSGHKGPVLSIAFSPGWQASCDGERRLDGERCGTRTPGRNL